ncbi:hypothetical protein H3S75_13405 [Gilliamella sp. B14384G15]|uniref:hypothetical protein n=1 Tax=unclassified Gilliamella TaxID=2685620 RepID=UPI0018DDB9FC|nr:MULTISPECIES: hypothetical protein [unclassified Gilliamella]MBI0032230.1 hypothetical protein [Gilliamella sp. B14384G15]MBI0059513.1 hypothetical protein [Gilliamella sp. B14384G12]
MKKLQHHLMLIIGLFLATALTGCFCTQKAEVLPKSSLPNAILGIPYYAKIKVFGGVANSDHFAYVIQPEKSGLELSPRGLGTKRVSYNNLEVKGTPKVAGTITIELSGSTYGTNTCTGKRYNKVYTIKVEE